MRSTAYHRRSMGPAISPLVWIAAASFIAGFGGFLLIGLNTLN
jgi:hypothetical protein